MMRRIAADTCIQLMMEHKAVFFELIDAMDSAGATSEISQSLYLQCCRRLIERVVNSDRHDARQEAARLRIAFDIDNLKWNGLLVQVDPQADTLTFQTFVIDLLRHLDSTRIKSLSNADFDDLRKQYARLKEIFSRLERRPGLADFDEACHTLFEKLRHTHALVKRNIDALTGRANRLAADVKHQDHTEGDDYQNRRRTLGEIAHLYDRFVIPCAQFLNPNENMSGGQSFVQALRAIEDLFADSGLPSLATHIQYRSSSIHSYYKSIASVERQLKRYYRQHQRSRQLFEALEKAYNRLTSASDYLYSGQLRDKHLALEFSLTGPKPLFAGLKSEKTTQTTKIGWQDQVNMKNLQELLRVHQASLGALWTEEERQPVTIDQGAKAQHARMQREKLVHEHIQTIPLSEGSKDIVETFHHYLKGALPYYQLSDTLTAMRYFMASLSDSKRLQPTGQQKTLTDSRYYYEYWVRQLIPDTTKISHRSTEESLP